MSKMDKKEHETPEERKKRRELQALAQYGLTEERLEELKNFIELLKFNYGILEVSHLKFLKDWLVNDLKATIPKQTEYPPPPPEFDTSHRSYAKAASTAAEESEKPGTSSTGKPGSSSTAWGENIERSDDEEEEESETSEDDESDLEIDMEGVIAGDTDPPQEMGSDNKEPSEAEQEEVTSMRQLGMEALSNGDSEGAIKHFTSGILLDNKKTVLFIKRGTAYLRLSKPNAAKRDAMKALSINPDSAAAFKVLGKAQKLLGEWEDACHSFEEAQKIDFDPDLSAVISEIKPKANKIREHKLIAERKRKAKEAAARQKRVEKAKKAQEKARKEQEKRDKEQEDFLRQNMPKMPGMFNFAGETPMPGTSSSQQASGDGVDAEPKVFEIPEDLD